MSGQQIGTVVGAVIGGYFFGPAGAQIGGAIGGYIGGVIDPTEIFGPRLTDASTQTARDGVPRTYGYGTFPSSGNLIWCSDLRERKNTEGGKGSTTETITYQYFRSYAIAVCEGPADGNGIAGYRIVKRNGKVVYDTRTDAELTSLGYSANEIAETRAAQAKFTNKARFYYGISDQEPDPTIQAVKGSDDVPGYSYTAYMVVTDDDVTELRGAVPQYEFVISVCGDRTDDDQIPQFTLLISGTGISGAGPFATSAITEVPDFQLCDPLTGADLEGGIPGFTRGVSMVATGSETRISSDNLQSWQTGSMPFSPYGVGRLAPGNDGWLAQKSVAFTADGMARAFVAGNSFSEFSFNAIIGSSPEPINNLSMARYTGGYWYAAGNALAGGALLRASTLQDEIWENVYGTRTDAIIWIHDVIDAGGGNVYVTCQQNISVPLQRYQLRMFTDGGPPGGDVLIDSTDPDFQPWQIEMLGSKIIVLCWGSEHVYTSNDNYANPIPTGIATNKGSSIQDQDRGRQLVAAPNGLVYIISGSDSDPAKANKCVTFDGVDTISSPVSLPITDVLGITLVTLSGLVPIPDAPGYYTDPQTGEIIGPGGTTITQCAPTLAEIVEDQCAIREVTTVDVSELEDDDVLGFRIANTSSPQKNILAAQPGYFFDSSEFDGVLHFPKRGGPDSFNIPFDEMVMREGETVQWERTQEAELLRKVTFTYFDPRATYTPTSQTGERRAGTIQAMGETASQLPLVGTGDWAAKAADINLKSAWYEPDECTFPVSLDWAELVPAAVGTIEDERGTIHRVRILDIKDDGLIRLVKARRTDASAYQSNASGKPIPLPTFPGSDIRGPTTSSVFNIPAVLDSHDRPGIYWAATGAFTSWIGAVLQVQRAGQWVTLAQTVSGATVGTLADDLPYHGGDIDNINTLSIRINSTLESVTYTQLLNERNPFVIAYPDGTGEIIQFQDAELDSEGIWNCTKLLRGRLNTREGLHLAGATIAALDSLIQFVDLRPDDLGKTLFFRVISSGTDPDSGTPFTVEFDRIWSSTEWEVAELEVVKDGDDFTVSWIPRHRLGTDVNPIRSVNWDGFLVRYQYADQFFEEVITDTSKTYNLPGASDVEFTVFQLNRLTGAGPGVSVTHE